jgi:hypothetical protein
MASFAAFTASHRANAHPKDRAPSATYPRRRPRRSPVSAPAVTEYVSVQWPFDGVDVYAA